MTSISATHLDVTMAQMRAILIKGDQGPIENLYMGQTPKPVPGEGEVLVKVKAFGLNRMDISQREGKYPPPAGSSTILGVEFSGLVDRIGHGVLDWKVNDQVLGLAGGGGYAEFIAVPQGNILRKPSHLSWEEAASIPENFLTAFQALVLCGELKQNEDVLIHAGASGVGTAAIQLSHLFGARTVTTTASTQEKLNWLLSIPKGATHAVNYKTQDFSEEVKKATSNKGVDVIIDFVGKTHWRQNIDSLGVDGRMIILSFLSGNMVSSVDLLPILTKRLRIQGSTLRSRSLDYQADLISRFGREVLGRITGSADGGPIRTYIHKVYAWTEIQAAHREMEENKNSGKIVAVVA